MHKIYPALLLLWAVAIASGEDLTPAPVTSPTINQENPPKDDLFALIEQQTQTEADWKSWPLDPSKGNQARMETTAVVIKYPYRDIHFDVYAYQLPDGAASLPWVTYVWVDRGKKYQTPGLSPTPLMVCANHNTARWNSLESISKSEWTEINRIAEHVTELPLQVEGKKVQARRLRVTRRVHPAPENLLTQGGAATIHELEWADGTPLAIAESGRIEKPAPEIRHP